MHGKAQHDSPILMLLAPPDEYDWMITTNGHVIIAVKLGWRSKLLWWLYSSSLHCSQPQIIQSYLPGSTHMYPYLIHHISPKWYCDSRSVPPFLHRPRYVKMCRNSRHLAMLLAVLVVRSKTASCLVCFWFTCIGRTWCRCVSILIDLFSLLIALTREHHINLENA